MLFRYVRWKAVFSWNLLNKMCHSILLLNVNFAFADVRPVWKVTIVNNDTTVALCWKHSPTQTFGFNALLCGSLQNVLKVTEYDAFISCSGNKCIWVCSHRGWYLKKENMPIMNVIDTGLWDWDPSQFLPTVTDGWDILYLKAVNEC